MVGVGLAGEAGDNVGADGGVRKLFVDEFDAAGVMFRAIPAVHSGEDAVGAGLQWHVKVLGEAARGSEKVDQVLGNILRFDGGEAQTVERSFVEDAAK